MQNLLSDYTRHGAKHRTNPAQTSSNENIQKQLFQMYEQRMKSLMETVRIYQENIQKDNQDGALAFMMTQQMATYRIDREFQLLRDALLTQKQKLVIKVLTSFHQLKKQFDLYKQDTLQKGSFSKNNLGNVAEKDIHSKAQNQRQRQSRFGSKIVEKFNNSNSKMSLISNSNEVNCSASITLYEKMLQQKLILIRQIQRKNKNLLQQNQAHLQKINQLNTKLQKSISQQLSMKQCKLCPKREDTIQKLKSQIATLSNENQKCKIKLNEQQKIKSTRDQQLRVKDLNIRELQKKVQVLQNEQHIIKQEVALRQQQQNEKSDKPSLKINMQTMKQLKQKLIFQQQQLMTITNSFDLLKEDLADSLYSEVKRLRNSHLALKESLKVSINNMKKQMFTSFLHIIDVLKENYKKKQVNNDLIKSLRRIDNQLDFFLEQKNILI